MHRKDESKRKTAALELTAAQAPAFPGFDVVVVNLCKVFSECNKQTTFVGSDSLSIEKNLPRRSRSNESKILLMEELLHHLGCKNLVNSGINYQPQLVSRIFFLQQ